MYTVLEEVAEMFAIKAFEKNLELIIHTSPNIPDYIIGDVDRVRQVLMNLLSNAVKFTIKGEICLSAELMANSNEQTAWVRITCSDTGIGISNNKLGSLFTSFYQADSSTTRQFGGTGLGLAICKGFITQMGGQLNVSSEEGVGSTFTCEIPFKSKNTTKEKQKLLPNPVSILVVDSNPKRCKILEEYLTSWGCTTKFADSAKNAFKILKKNTTSYSVMICYHKLLDCMGAEFLSQVSLTIPASPFTKILVHPLTRHVKSIPQNIHILWEPIKRKPLWSLLTDLNETQLPSPDCSPLIGHTDTNNTAKILVVDDNVSNLKVATILLKSVGLMCSTAANGQEMLDICEDINFDIIFLDLHMPVLNGIEACKQFRERESFKLVPKRTPIIAMTAACSVQDRKKCFDAGMDAFLTKPVQKKSLTDILSQYIPQYYNKDNTSQKPTFTLSPALSRKVTITKTANYTKKFTNFERVSASDQNPPSPNLQPPPSNDAPNVYHITTNQPIYIGFPPSTSIQPHHLYINSQPYSNQPTLHLPFQKQDSKETHPLKPQKSQMKVSLKSSVSPDFSTSAMSIVIALMLVVVVPFMFFMNLLS
eukprot:TRINITY_DN13547_c0_g1_i2.p1 TRINITY_DN13547_c0_g1~~TRINITY_DN13547_c0_g1_i2.p1  ORF type:complete len:592 (+),score=150.09 TRINITY_DN13547_c0_g1_i2:89-1864(+)